MFSLFSASTSRLFLWPATWRFRCEPKQVYQKMFHPQPREMSEFSRPLDFLHNSVYCSQFVTPFCQSSACIRLDNLIPAIAKAEQAEIRNFVVPKMAIP